MRSDRSDDGATLVEAAFTIPLFFFLLLGVIDFGMLAFEDNKASNAARDGARVGIIDYRGLDDVTSSDFAQLKATIQQNLPGQTIDDTNLEVKCVTPAGLDTACSSARVDIDRVSVSVSWMRNAISPVASVLGFDPVEIDGEARMTIVGAPRAPGGSPLPACNLSGISVSPASVERVTNGSKVGQLKSDLDVTVSGTGTCVAETVRLIAPDGSSADICTGNCLGTTTYDKAANSFWTAGTGTAQLLDSGLAVIDTATFQVTDPSVPPPCNVTGVDVTPNPVERVTSGANAGTLVSNLAVEVSGSGTCNLTVTLTAPSGGTAVVCTGGCLGTSVYSAQADNFWTAGTAQVTVTGDGSATNTFTVTDAPPCAVTVAVTPAQTKSDGNNVLDKAPGESGNVKLRVTVSPSGPCSNLTVTLRATNGTTDFTLCSGPCSGPVFYSGNDRVWTVPSGGVGTGRVDVSGDATATATFEVRK